MQRHLLRRIVQLPLEEKILGASSGVALLCVFFPWLSGEWLGGEIVSYSGLGFYTSIMGFGILLLHAFLLALCFSVPLGGPEIISRRHRDSVRLVTAVLAAVLTVGAWSVLTKFTFEFSRLEINFGLYGTLIGSLVASLYAFLGYREKLKREVQAVFSHPESIPEAPEPPTEGPEEHRMYR